MWPQRGQLRRRGSERPATSHPLARRQPPCCYVHVTSTCATRIATASRPRRRRLDSPQQLKPTSVSGNVLAAVRARPSRFSACFGPLELLGGAPLVLLPLFVLGPHHRQHPPNRSGQPNGKREAGSEEEPAHWPINHCAYEYRDQVQHHNLPSVVPGPLQRSRHITSPVQAVSEAVTPPARSDGEINAHRQKGPQYDRHEYESGPHQVAATVTTCVMPRGGRRIRPPIRRRRRSTST